MDYMGTREASEKWGCSQASVSSWCKKGLIPGVEQDRPRSPWRIPVNAKCPSKIVNSQVKQ